MDLAALINPGVFKAHKKNPERMLKEFNLYVKLFNDFIVVTDNTQAMAAKKSILRAIGCPDMVFMFNYVVKVPAEAIFHVAIETICAAITGKTNQAMIRFQLFMTMPQDNEPFSIRWTKVKEQVDKCVFNGYN